MEEVNNNKIFYDRICQFCINKNNCAHDKFTEEKFYNGISTKRCRDYKFKSEVDNNE